ncbi:Essential MCU regulator, mitochondrial [Bulinus truncatus]|nr:Essential MCU regulator, mitochondrial [Bulinus truncatus]
MIGCKSSPVGSFPVNHDDVKLPLIKSLVYIEVNIAYIMATSNFRLLASQTHKLILDANRLCTANRITSKRTIVKNDNGALLPRPTQVRFGLIKVALTITPFLLGGARLSQEFAAWLEEHELFVPDDDDD